MTETQKPGAALVVDDDVIVSKLVRRVLTEAGWLVTSAVSGNEAMTILKNQRFDLVVTDIVMPEVDGIEIIAAVREHQPTARIVAMSGGGLVMSSLQALNIAGDLGATVRLEKPFTPEQLRDAIAGRPPKRAKS